MEADKLRIRCSSLGKIMTNPRSKSEVLSGTCRTYIKELFLMYEYDIVKDFWSRYTDKGIRVERDSIMLANDVFDWKLTIDDISGDQMYFKNEWINGATDVCTDHLLADVKSSWDGTTFPWFDTELTNKSNIWQMQGYMWLTGHEQAEVVYCLIDTPEDMILDEIRREHWKQNSNWNGDEDPDIIDHVRKKHVITDRLSDQERAKRFIVKRDEYAIHRLKERITLCREYYAELLALKNGELSAHIKE